MHLLQCKERSTEPISQLDFDSLWAEPSAEDVVLIKEENKLKEVLVKKLNSQLPPRQQEALRLLFVESFDYTNLCIS